MPTPQPRPHHRVTIIGAGPGGLSTAVQLLDAGYDDFVILEQAPAVGGTWYHNRYPGAECDVLSHCYSFSFHLNPRWTRTYARQPEIQAYMERTVEEFGLGPRLRLSTPVRALTWRDADSRWEVALGDGSVVEADVVVSALGMFNEPYLPSIPGRESFAGRAVHTARWPDELELTGERVAVIGSAATAVQLIPEVAELAEHLLVFQRTATWVLPKEDRPYSEEELAHFGRDPGALVEFRDYLVDRINLLMTFRDPDHLRENQERGLAHLQVVEDAELRAKLTPTFPWGARRPILSNTYYPTFNRDDVTLVCDRIEAITPEGIRTVDGREHAVDVIIFATGFATTKYLGVLDVTGRDGLRLEDAWADDPIAYLGAMTSGFPNLFMLYGPNTNNGSIITMLEHAAAFAVRQVRLLDEAGLAWIDVKRDVMEAFNVELQAELDKTAVWQADTAGYYRGRSGRIVTQWPGTMDEYSQRLREVGLEHFEHAAK